MTVSCMTALLQDVSLGDSPWAIFVAQCFRGAGFFLREAVRLSVVACWASWADTLHQIKKRHLNIADNLLEELDLGQSSEFASV